jgi:hypothetical protein
MSGSEPNRRSTGVPVKAAQGRTPAGLRWRRGGLLTALSRLSTNKRHSAGHAPFATFETNRRGRVVSGLARAVAGSLFTPRRPAGKREHESARRHPPAAAPPWLIEVVANPAKITKLATASRPKNTDFKRVVRVIPGGGPKVALAFSMGSGELSRGRWSLPRMGDDKKSR